MCFLCSKRLHCNLFIPFISHTVDASIHRASHKSVNDLKKDNSRTKYLPSINSSTVPEGDDARTRRQSNDESKYKQPSHASSVHTTRGPQVARSQCTLRPGQPAAGVGQGGALLRLCRQCESQPTVLYHNRSADLGYLHGK